MSIWILIVYIAGSSPISIEGFQTKDSCEKAVNNLPRSLKVSGRYVDGLCVEREGIS